MSSATSAKRWLRTPMPRAHQIQFQPQRLGELGRTIGQHHDLRLADPALLAQAPMHEGVVDRKADHGVDPLGLERR